jgi:phosphopantothenoylcysteine decarboxylase/phosphopantothenate--cysteine ligase
MANDLLTTICLATAAPIAIAPAMNQQMWHASATQDNIKVLSQRGYQILGPGAGEQACGDIGLGRMLEVNELVKLTCENMAPAEKILTGQQWLITAGPTREAIDPVRYISNHSSGKMGFAIAQAAEKLGAKVTIISGPVALNTPEGCNKIAVNSAQEMHQQALSLAPQAQVFVACAAVADYRLDNIAAEKIKKSSDTMQLNLIKNPDIVADVAALKNKPFTVGFAAETQDIEHYARGKLARKNLDMIAANNVATPGQGFNSDENALTVFSSESETVLPLATKSEIAMQLVHLVDAHYQKSLKDAVGNKKA